MKHLRRLSVKKSSDPEMEELTNKKRMSVGSMGSAGSGGAPAGGGAGIELDEIQMGFKESIKSIWHAFTTLDVKNTGNVQISQVKVILNNIAAAYNIGSGEEILNGTEYTGLRTVDFDTLLKMYRDKIFTTFIEMAEKDVEHKFICHPDFEKIDAVSWTIVNQMVRSFGKNITDATTSLFLWKIYNYFAEVDTNSEPLLPVRLVFEEVNFIVQMFQNCIGHEDKKLVTDLVKFTFMEFCDLLDNQVFNNIGEDEVKFGVAEVYKHVIKDIIKSGAVSKRGHKVATWKDRWFVLTRKELKYFTDHDEKELKGTITMNKTYKIDMLPEKSGKKNGFVLTDGVRPYCCYVANIKLKNEWIAALNKAIEFCDSTRPTHKISFMKRLYQRMEARKLREDEERQKRLELERQENQLRELNNERLKRLEEQNKLERNLLELEEEKRAKAELAEKLSEEEALHQADLERLRELEEIKRELERLLEEEKQAKKDEEIVRALQARLLEEEIAKRHQLEKLQQEKEQLLREERTQKDGLVEAKRQQEEMYKMVQEQLEQLELERKDASSQLQVLEDKLIEAEQERFKLKERQKLRELKSSIPLASLVCATVAPFSTHRGKGAFCDGDFTRKDSDACDVGLNKSNADENQNYNEMSVNDEHLPEKLERKTNSEQINYE